MMRLFVDTATSGRWEFSRGATDSMQPHMTRLVWSLEGDGPGAGASAAHLILLPRGARIDAGASAATNINEVDLVRPNAFSAYGAISEFCRTLSRADEIIGFNVGYQKLVLEREMRKPDENGQERVYDVAVVEDGVKHVGIPGVWPQSVCTQQRLSPVLGLAWSGGGGKWPSFEEASEIITGAKIPRRLPPLELGIRRLEHIRRFYERIMDQEQQQRYA